MSRSSSINTSGTGGSSSREHHSHQSSAAVLGECGYCGQTIVAKKHKFLPLECSNCRGVYHVSCLRGNKPQTLLGDQLFKFSCAYCSTMGTEICSRPYLHWVHITHLVLYNLIVGRKSPQGRMGRDKREYFRWNEDICGFMRTHWNKLMPDRKRTQSWRSTVAGTLSVNCPSVFQSGQSLFGEPGWWTLTSVTPPDPRQAITSSPPTLGKRSTPLTLSPPPYKRSAPFTLSPPPHKRTPPFSPPPHRKSTSSLFSPPLVKKKASFPLSPPPHTHHSRTSHSLTPVASPTPPAQDSAMKGKSPLLTPLTQRQEQTLLTHLTAHAQAISEHPTAARLYRKLKVKQLQRRYGLATFNLDKIVTKSLEQTIKYVVESSKPHYEQVVPVKRLTSDLSYSRIKTTSPPPEVSSGEEVLKRVTVLAPPLPHTHTSLRESLEGCSYSNKPIVSPHTTRVLKPFIFRTNELRPLRVRLNAEICKKKSEYKVQSFNFVYLQDHLISAVNNFVSTFFWKVDLSEYMQCPDFTCIVLYGCLVIGCAFMTPDVKVNEAYISFLAVHPEFQRCGLGKLMLYHLVQTCMGKDVTLHVSIDNPAMFLYHKFGFKAEKYCLDFYEHYYPSNHHLSKHAYFMRLRR